MSLHLRITSISEIPLNEIKINKINAICTILETSEEKISSFVSSEPYSIPDIVTFKSVSRKNTVEIIIQNVDKNKSSTQLAYVRVPINCTPTNLISHFKGLMFPRSLSKGIKINIEFHFDNTGAKPFKADKGKFNTDAYIQFKDQLKNSGNDMSDGGMLPPSQPGTPYMSGRGNQVQDPSMIYGSRRNTLPVGSQPPESQNTSNEYGSRRGLNNNNVVYQELSKKPEFSIELYNAIIANFSNAPDEIISLMNNPQFLEASVGHYINITQQMQQQRP